MDKINKFIELTNLDPVITDRDIDSIINQAQEYDFQAICIPPFWVKKATRELNDWEISVATTVGFPYGYNMAETKMEEIKNALNNGAVELDIVFNYSAFKSQMTWPKIELSRFAEVIHQKEGLFKLVIDTSILNEEEMEEIALVGKDAGVDYITISTGLSGDPINIKHVQLLHNLVSPKVGIKALSEINSYEQAKLFISSGVDRLGITDGIKIMQIS